jgi:hypothetical protein
MPHFFPLAFVLFAALKISSGGVALTIPDGWRTLDNSDRLRLKPEVQPQTDLQKRFEEDRSNTNAALVAMKHDVPGGRVAASIQVFRAPVPAKLHGASPIEIARVIAAVTQAAAHATSDEDPREITVAGRAAASFGLRYTLVEKDGPTHAMRMRCVIVGSGNQFYNIGYAGPADDDDDFKQFDEVLKSFEITP